MPIGKTFEISLEVAGEEASLAGVKVYSYSHADGATVGKSASRRQDQFKGELFTAKIAYPEGQVPGSSTTLGDLVDVAKTTITDVFGDVLPSAKVEAPVVEAPVAAPVVEAPKTEEKVTKRGKKVEEKVEAPKADYPDFVEGAAVAVDEAKGDTE